MGLMSTKSLQKAVREISARVSKTAADKDPAFTARYVGSVGHENRQPDEQSKLRFLGLGLPQVHALAKAAYSFSDRSIEEQIEIWLKLYHSSAIYEELILALIWLGHPKRWERMLKAPSVVFGLQKRVDNWAVSDTVSEFVAALLEGSPDRHFGQMKRWNVSKNPWDRRQSLVGLYCYARGRKRPLPSRWTLPLVENLIDDPHYFVQKAVGWSLREIHHVDSKAQKEFLKKHLSRLSSAAFATATEKYSTREKEVLKALRARARKSRASVL
jgi:3-methyladenine DNA glycosylase AlkD